MGMEKRGSWDEVKGDGARGIGVEFINNISGDG